MSKIAGNFCQKPDCKNYKVRYCRQHLSYTVPVKNEIEKVSEKKKKADKEYSKVRKQYLAANPFCEAKIADVCTKAASEIHHQIGKASEEDYLNPDYFLAVCRGCHDVIEKSPAFARQQGFSLSRHAKRA
jgi:hypothetical protein